MKRLTLLEAAESLLREAEGWIKDQLEGTSFYGKRWRSLGPERAAIERAKEQTSDLVRALQALASLADSRVNGQDAVPQSEWAEALLDAQTVLQKEKP
jgi:Tfp pilus assembly protein PilX